MNPFLNRHCLEFLTAALIRSGHHDYAFELFGYNECYDMVVLSRIRDVKMMVVI